MKRKIKKRYIVLPAVFIIILTYLFWGPLFPWNPFKFGYQVIQSQKATIFISEMTAKDSVIFHIDDIIAEEESFHDLEYKDDFKIIILNQESNMKRYLPWLKGSGYSVSLGLINVVYIGPNARKSPNGIERYLKHELSHLLIAQNASIDKAKLIHEQAWFVEGIAEYISKHSFYSKNEFVVLCRQRDFNFNGLYEKSPLMMSLSEVKFYYTYYRFFIAFLVENYGVEKIKILLKKYLLNPQDYKSLLEEVYNKDLITLLKLYRSSLNLSNMK